MLSHSISLSLRSPHETRERRSLLQRRLQPERARRARESAVRARILHSESEHQRLEHRAHCEWPHFATPSSLEMLMEIFALILAAHSQSRALFADRLQPRRRPEHCCRFANADRAPHGDACCRPIAHERPVRLMERQNVLDSDVSTSADHKFRFGAPNLHFYAFLQNGFDDRGHSVGRLDYL